MNIDAAIHGFTLCFRDPIHEEMYHTEQKQKRDKITFVSVWVCSLGALVFMIYTWLETLLDPTLAHKSAYNVLRMLLMGWCILLEVCALCFRILLRTRGFWFILATVIPVCLLAADYPTKTSVVFPMYV